MVRSKEEIMTMLRGVVGDNSNDDIITLLEDVDDTLSIDNTALKNEAEEWKRKFEENDENWRKKYRDRFYGDVDDTEDKIFNEDFSDGETKKTKYEDLFMEG